jgi:hypothetical protein
MRLTLIRGIFCVVNTLSLAFYEVTTKPVILSAENKIAIATEKYFSKTFCAFLISYHTIFEIVLKVDAPNA